MEFGKTIAFYTLGCKLNFAETSTIAKQLLEMGYRRVKRGEKAAVCLINTCTVTDSADRKSRQAIRRIIKENDGAYIIVVGCYAQLKPEEVKGIEGVNLILGANDKFVVPKLLNEGGEKNYMQCSDTRGKTAFHHSCSAEDRTRHFLKVQDGCDYFCTYCAIPMARGRSRNDSIASIVAEAKRVAEEGGKEIVLTGVNIGDFGKSTNEQFIDLVKALDEVEGIERFRISSIEPNLLSDDVIEFVASSKRFAPHFHIPLQSGSDRVLELMHRRYDTALFAHKIGLVKRLMPNAFIGVDVIVGMRGEEVEDFDRARCFIESLPVTQLHVFPYSERANTQALKINPVVSPTEKKRRSEMLLKVSAEKLQQFYTLQEGTRHVVLWEATKREGKMFGFTENYVKVSCSYDATKINTVESVVIGKDVVLSMDKNEGE